MTRECVNTREGVLFVHGRVSATQIGQIYGKKIDDRTESRVPKSGLPGLGGAPTAGKFLDLFSGVSALDAPRLVPSPNAREAERLASEGKRLIRMGRAAKAVDVLKRAVDLKPDAAAMQLDLGDALMAAGRLQEAVETLALAIRLDARMPTAHFYLAQIFDGFGQEAMAIAGYKAAVALKPDLVDAQMRLGDLYLARDLRADAQAAFRAAASASARDGVTARIAEARAVEASGDFEAALAKMRAAVAAHPKSGEARAILATLLTQSGRLEEAATEFERASELTLDMNSVWIGITTNRKITANDDALLARMKAALSQPRLSPRHRQLLHFALGKAHDDRGEYELAMRNFDEGNQLRGMGSEFEREGLARRVDQIIAAAPPSFFDRSPNVGVDDATPILIVGMPRSGSTLTEQILSSHPDVAAGGELGFWSSPRILRQDLLSVAGDAEAAKRVANDYIATLKAVEPAAKRVTDKALANFFLLGILHRLLPKATLIHCRRHPSTRRSPFSPRISKPTSITRRAAAISSSITGSTRGSWIIGEMFCRQVGSLRWITNRWSAIPSRRLDGSSPPAASTGTTPVSPRIETRARSRRRAFGRRASRSTERLSSAGGDTSRGWANSGS